MMNTVLFSVVTVAEEDAMSRISYMGLAHVAFESDSPTRAMISSVARAARTLKDWDLVTIDIDERDRRRRWVGPSRWLLISLRIQLDLASAFGEDFSALRLKETISMVRKFYEEGLIEVEDSTGAIHKTER